MAYMAADLSAELDAHAVRDLREMESAAIDPAVRVVVQINRHWPSLPQRYVVENREATVAVANVPQRNMGCRTTLEAFLTWAVEEDVAAHGEDEDRGYMLVLWGHAYGLGFGRDHRDGLRLDELQGALTTFRKVRPGGRPLDILGANACAMAYAEAAYQLREQAEYMVASQIAVPFAGWPFDTVLRAIKPGTPTQRIGQLIVDRYVSTFRAAGKEEVVAMSLLNLAALRSAPADAVDFLKAFGALATALHDVVGGADRHASERLTQVRAAFLSAGVGEVRPLIDLRDLCRKLVELATDLDVLGDGASGIREMKAAAERLDEFLEPEGAGGLRGSTTSARFLVVHKHTGEPRGLNGLGIFAPFVTDPADLKRLEIGHESSDGEDTGSDASIDKRATKKWPPVGMEQRTGRATYEALDLMDATTWAELVYDTLRAGLPTDLINNVESSGATSRAHRAAVTQMLVAVDSLFDVLDRRIAAARHSTGESLKGAPATGGLVPKQPDRFLELQLVDHKAVRAAAQLATTAGVKKSPPPQNVPAVARNAITCFEALETTLGELERAVRRTLTNGTFGLGPGPGGSVSLATGHGKGGGGHGAPGDKGGGGHGAPRDDKAGGGHGAPDEKAGGGHGPVPIGMIAGVAVTAPAEPLMPSDIVAGLFADVGDGLNALEAAIGDAETLFATAVTSGGDVVNGGPPNAMQVQRAFRIAEDASTQARRILRRVLAHPVYGFGPGPENVTVEDRRELARAGGLSSAQLQLL
jgi:hypothetical protein